VVLKLYFNDIFISILLIIGIVDLGTSFGKCKKLHFLSSFPIEWESDRVQKCWVNSKGCLMDVM